MLMTSTVWREEASTTIQAHQLNLNDVGDANARHHAQSERLDQLRSGQQTERISGDIDQTSIGDGRGLNAKSQR